MEAFKNCYYDYFHKTIYLKEQHTKGWQKFKYKPWCYITDTTGKSNILDIYKRPVMKYEYKDKTVIDSLKQNPDMIVAESDLKPEVKFMHERYDKEELKVDIDDWNIGLFDIEVAGSSRFYDTHLIEIRDLQTNRFEQIELFIFDTRYKKEEWEVFDIEKKCWVKYLNSCYVSYEFPAPEKAEWPINLISMYSTRDKKLYTWGTRPYDDLDEPIDNYLYCRTELDLVRNFMKWFARQDFDMISGWNSEAYDIPYICNRCAKLRKIHNIQTEWECALSPFGKLPEKHDIKDRKLEDVDLGATFTIPGLYSIDFMKLYKTFGNHPPLPSYSLNYIASRELKDEKLKYEGSINEVYKDNWNLFVRYNRKDVKILIDLFYKLKLFELIIEYAFDCIVTVDKVENKVPTTTGYFIKFLHATGRVLNDKKDKHIDWWTQEECYKIKQKDGSIYYQNTEWENKEEFNKYLLKYDMLKKLKPESEIRTQVLNIWKPKKINGVQYNGWQLFNREMEEFRKWPHPFPEFQVKAGYCYDFPGRFDDDMSFDITSSYPHHIMMFNMSPETKVIHPTRAQIESGEVIMTDVAEVGFLRTDDAIMPNVVRQVFAERKVWKDKEEEAIMAGDMELANLCHNRQMTKKLIINSMYGVSLAQGFHFYDPDIARCICRCARVTLRDWLSRYCNEYYVSTKMIKDIEKYFKIELKNKAPLKITNRDFAIVHNDTDSCYICVHELRERLIKEGLYSNRKTKPLLQPEDGMTDEQLAELHKKNREIMDYNKTVEDEYRDFFAHAEEMFQDFFNQVLEIRANKSKVKQLIKFNRENIFSNMFCFAKKLYIGSVIDSEGAPYPMESLDLDAMTTEEKEALPKSMAKHPEGPKHKIMGVPIKKSTMPDFCKVAAEKLAFDISAGMSKSEANEFIMKVYEQYCNSNINDISAVIGITNYKKYIPYDIDYYVQNGLEFEKGKNTSVIFGAKAALIYNYILAKKKFKLTPIQNNSKMKYIYVKPNNEFKYKNLDKHTIEPVNFVAFVDSWPKEFDSLFEIDHETMFRKSFCALFESMYIINKWLKPGEHLVLEKSTLEDIFC